MDRLSWSAQTLLPGESVVFQQSSTSLYDGDDKSAFAGGVSCLTDHRFLWKDSGDPLCILGLPLQYVVDTAEAKGGLFAGKRCRKERDGTLIKNRYRFSFPTPHPQLATPTRGKGGGVTSWGFFLSHFKTKIHLFLTLARNGTII